MINEQETNKKIGEILGKNIGKIGEILEKHVENIKTIPTPHWKLLQDNYFQNAKYENIKKDKIAFSKKMLGLSKCFTGVKKTGKIDHLKSEYFDIGSINTVLKVGFETNNINLSISEREGSTEVNKIDAKKYRVKVINDVIFTDTDTGYFEVYTITSEGIGSTIDQAKQIGITYRLRTYLINTFSISTVEEEAILKKAEEFKPNYLQTKHKDKDPVAVSKEINKISSKDIIIEDQETQETQEVEANEEANEAIQEVEANEEANEAIQEATKTRKTSFSGSVVSKKSVLKNKVQQIVDPIKKEAQEENETKYKKTAKEKIIQRIKTAYEKPFKQKLVEIVSATCTKKGIELVDWQSKLNLDDLKAINSYIAELESE